MRCFIFYYRLSPPFPLHRFRIEWRLNGHAQRDDRQNWLDLVFFSPTAKTIQNDNNRSLKKIKPPNLEGELKHVSTWIYVRSEPGDGSSQIGRLLVGIERSGRGREIGIVKEQSPIAAHAFQLVVVGRQMPGTSDARPPSSAAGQTSTSLVLGRLFIRPVPCFVLRMKEEKEHSIMILCFFLMLFSFYKSHQVKGWQSTI